MSRYIEPTTDFGFKKLFGEERSKNVLIDAHGDIIYYPRASIKSVVPSYFIDSKSLSYASLRVQPRKANSSQIQFCF